VGFDEQLVRYPEHADALRQMHSDWWHFALAMKVVLGRCEKRSKRGHSAGGRRRAGGRRAPLAGGRRPRIWGIERRTPRPPVPAGLHA
jgi:hypothetical protein